MPQKRDSNENSRSLFAVNAVDSDPTIRNWFALYLCIVGYKPGSCPRRHYTTDEALKAMGCTPRKEDYGETN